MANRVEFVSYDGEYPNYCNGTLTLRIEGATIQMPDFCMHNCGGNLWLVDTPDFLAEYYDDIKACVNANVPCYHCHGCD